ncbi:hypothetical protein R5R35_013592 [Gryllus longicercus]|uniref:Aminopeptidase N n=1 Tax=Gryllus longicercus TaxID=2509291 RepID=A0AAN9V8J8_9ORTH
MENWGLVTYRESMLLFNDGTASARQGIATVIAHELTHMWFGNLVTTRWWDATWLNEGFAQYFQFYATGLVKPAWRLMEQFVVDHHQAVMGADALPTAAALTSPAHTPAQVSARFGSITYSKGASILRMISAIMGENKFLEALHEYLVENRYSTTIPEDLFQHLVEKSTDSNLDQNAFENLLRSWTEQPGYPVLKIDRNYEEGSATISQARFLLKSQTTPDPTLYYVPLTWVGPGGDFSATAPKAYLAQEQTRTVSGMPEPQQWVIFNVQETGFYRVNYDDTNWRLLSAHLLDPSQPLDGVHVLNRAQLLDDAFNLARAGQLDYAVAFDLADYLQRETDFIPWASALAAFSYLQRMLVRNDRYPVFEAYVRSLLEERYEHFGFRDREGHIDKLFLNRVSAWACSLQHPPCTRAARTALDGLLQGEDVPADLRSVVYCYGVRHSPKESWYVLLERYKISLDNAERALLMAGLACSYDEDLLNELLGYSIQGTFIRKQDAASVFSSVYSNSVGVEVALNFLDEHFDQVEEYYASMGAINNIVVGIAGRLTTHEQRDKMRSFVEMHSESLGNTADAALATVEENLEWLEDRQEIILKILEEKLTSEPTTTQTEPSTTESPTEPSTTESPTEPSTPSTTTDDAESLRATVLAVLALVLAVTML